jgi:hypothetical protein
LTIYPGYTAAAPDVPPRSRLYRLEPVGVGTPYVESLTGYVSRLAEAHGVTAAALFGWELAPRVGEKWLRRRYSNRAMILASRFRPLARAMNGTGETATDWVRVIGEATTQRGLRCLTMLTWRGVLSQRHLLRAARAWCPACYTEWDGQGRVVYEPLLWALGAVAVCPIHHSRLRTECNHCGRGQYYLDSHSRPGFCSACGGWLGEHSVGESQMRAPSDEEEARRIEWAATAAGELLAAATRLAAEPGIEVIARSTAACVGITSGRGNVGAFSRAHGLPKQTVGKWQRGEARVALDSLLRFCLRAGVSPADFLTGEVNKGGFEVRPVPAGKPDGKRQPPAARRRRSIDRNADGRALSAALKETPPRSMVAVARGMGRQHSALRYQFPELCKAIVARYAEYRSGSALEDGKKAERALEESLADMSHPCVAEVARRLGWTFCRLRRRFPELCRLVTDRHAESRKECWQKVEDSLRESLEEEPPPSMAEMVGRTDYSETSLYAHFPALCRRIGRRHLAYRKGRFGRRRDEFAAEVRAGALALYAEGVYPSVKRVQSLLSGEKSLRSSKIGLEELRRVREELGLDSRAESATRF